MKAGGFYPDVGGKEKEWAGISSSFGKWSGSVPVPWQILENSSYGKM